MKRLPRQSLTARLEMRLLGPEDDSLMLEVLNDPGFVAKVGDRGVRSLEAARRYIEQGAVASHAHSGLGVYRLGVSGTGEAAGICGLFQRAWLAWPDVGFALLPAHRARGYALEATQAVLALGFETLGLPRIGAITSAGHHRSIHVLERAGMWFEGFVLPDGEAEELRLYVKDRT